MRIKFKTLVASVAILAVACAAGHQAHSQAADNTQQAPTAAAAPLTVGELQAKIGTLTTDLDKLKISLKTAEDERDDEVSKREEAERELEAYKALVACIEGEPAYSASCYLSIVKNWRDTKAAEIAYDRAGKAVKPIVLPRRAPVVEYGEPMPPCSPASGVPCVTKPLAPRAGSVMTTPRPNTGNTVKRTVNGSGKGAPVTVNIFNNQYGGG